MQDKQRNEEHRKNLRRRSLGRQRRMAPIKVEVERKSIRSG
jgi:hypothetical protein